MAALAFPSRRSLRRTVARVVRRLTARWLKGFDGSLVLGLLALTGSFEAQRLALGLGRPCSRGPVQRRMLSRRRRSGDGFAANSGPVERFVLAAGIVSRPFVRAFRAFVFMQRSARPFVCSTRTSVRVYEGVVVACVGACFAGAASQF